MADLTEAQVIRDLARQGMQPVPLEAGRQYLVRSYDGAVVYKDLSDATPPFKKGVVTVRDVASFAEYWGRHADDDSEVFADITAGTVTAVLDAHHQGGEDGTYEPEFQARWQQHRLILRLTPTLPWQAWMVLNRQMIGQMAFAEHFEDNLQDLAPRDSYPDDIPPVSAADFLELAQHFTATTKVEFESGQRMATGETEIALKETSVASGGKLRKIAVPTRFCLAIAPYDDCSRARVTARFRYRGQQGGSLTMGYFLDQPERVREDAVREIAALVADETGRAVMLGVPAS